MKSTCYNTSLLAVTFQLEAMWSSTPPQVLEKHSNTDNAYFRQGTRSWYALSGNHPSCKLCLGEVAWQVGRFDSLKRAATLAVSCQSWFESRTIVIALKWQCFGQPSELNLALTHESTSPVSLAMPPLYLRNAQFAHSARMPGACSYLPA